MIKKILAVLAALLLMASFYVLAVIADPAPEEDMSRWVVTEDTTIAASGIFNSTGQSELAGAFGVTVPRLPGGGEGQVEDATYRGIPARLYTYRTDGGTVRAVRPVDAAPLLLQSGASVALQSVSVLGMQAVLSSSGTARSLYFAGDDAAYSLLADGLGEGDFLLLAGELVF